MEESETWTRVRGRKEGKKEGVAEDGKREFLSYLEV